MTRSFFPSVMRTVVPLGAGWLVSLAALAGVDVDGTTATTAVTAGAAAAYYGVFRGLEQLAVRLRWAPLRVAAGWLLGWARPPQYPAVARAPRSHVGSVVPPGDLL